MGFSRGGFATGPGGKWSGGGGRGDWTLVPKFWKGGGSFTVRGGTRYLSHKKKAVGLKRNRKIEKIPLSRKGKKV